jgi:DnaJ-class molecular chaperone
VAELAPTEIKALGRIIDELNYYQVLHLEAGASVAEVKRAYHENSRIFHPDANRHADGALRGAVEHIAKRVSEAYAVLRDPRRRQVYDRRLKEDGQVRIQLAEAKAEASRQRAEEQQGRTPQGRQYFTLATADLKRGDLEVALRNLQTALTFEPDNAVFKQQLEETRQKLR